MTSPMLTVELCCAELAYVRPDGSLQIEACRKFLQREEKRGRITSKKRGIVNVYHVDDVRKLLKEKEKVNV